MQQQDAEDTAALHRLLGTTTLENARLKTLIADLERRLDLAHYSNSQLKENTLTLHNDLRTSMSAVSGFEAQLVELRASIKVLTLASQRSGGSDELQRAKESVKALLASQKEKLASQKEDLDKLEEAEILTKECFEVAQLRQVAAAWVQWFCKLRGISESIPTYSLLVLSTRKNLCDAEALATVDRDHFEGNLQNLMNAITVLSSLPSTTVCLLERSALEEIAARYLDFLVGEFAILLDNIGSV